MSPELQKQLAELLAKLMNVAGDATQFAKEQIPPLVQEKITFGRVFETVSLLFLSAAFVVVTRLVVVAWKKAKEDHFENHLYPIAGSLGIIGLVLLMAGVWAQLEPTVMVWFAPRLYIVEWLKGMVTK